MECFSRVAHRIHSPEMQTEQICFFSFRIFGTRIPAPFRPYATTSAALASVTRMEETPTRNASGSGVFFGCRESTYRLGVGTLTRPISPFGHPVVPAAVNLFI